MLVPNLTCRFGTAIYSADVAEVCEFIFMRG
jgi:hypothetical protein